MEESKVLAKLQLQCSRREYCSKDILAKALKDLEGDREAAGRILDKLIEEKYVDDLRYASAFAREKSSLGGWGAVKIRYMLSSKGIPSGTIDEALAEIDPDAADRKMDTVLRTKYRTLKEDPQVKLKLLKFALGRGYGYDEVKERIDNIIHEE